MEVGSGEVGVLCMMSTTNWKLDIKKGFDELDKLEFKSALIWLKRISLLVTSLDYLDQLDVTDFNYFTQTMSLRYNKKIEKALTLLIKSIVLNDNTNNSKVIFYDEIEFIHKYNICSYFTSPIKNSFNNIIQDYVYNTCKSNYDQSYLSVIMNWMNSTIIPVYQLIHNNTHNQQNQHTDSNNNNINNYFTKEVYISLSFTRSKEIFEIITEFPDSIPAIEELRDVAIEVDYLSSIARSLRASLCKRLLHIGASTSQILDIYIAMIRTLKILDPSNLVLNYVAQPVRAYLTSRKDTVRCIVSSLTGKQGQDQLRSELKAGSSLEYCLDPDDDGDSPDPNWNPPKRTFDFPTSGDQGKDILAVLVSIYGSTDLFVMEYQSLLADKLLVNMNYTSDNEVASLELLKIRYI